MSDLKKLKKAELIELVEILRKREEDLKCNLEIIKAHCEITSLENTAYRNVVDRLKQTILTGERLFYPESVIEQTEEMRFIQYLHDIITEVA